MNVKLDKATRLSIALIAALELSQAETLNRIAEEANRLAAHKGDASKAREDGTAVASTLWADCLALAKATHEERGELTTEQVQAVYTALLTDTVGSKPEAAKSVKPYASTARKCIAAVDAGTVRGWGSLESVTVPPASEGEEATEAPVTYSEVRDALKGKGQREVDALRAEVAKMVGEIAGRENSVRNAGTRLAALETVKALLQPIRDEAVRVQDQAKASSKAAKAASDLKQQQPSAPMATEVSKAA